MPEPRCLAWSHALKGARRAPRAFNDREESRNRTGMAYSRGNRRLSRYGWSGQSNLAQMVRLEWSPSMPQSLARARTMSRPWYGLDIVTCGRSPGASLILDFYVDIVTWADHGADCEGAAG